MPVLSKTSTLDVVPGGRSVDFDELERAAWAELAESCARSLAILGPHHPERPTFLEMLRETRDAAGLDAGPTLDRIGA